MESYEKKHYAMTITDHDSLTLHKNSGSDWCEIRMQTNGFNDGHITIRSKEMTEALHFMLNQLLKD